MINVIFNDFSYELLPKRKEIFEKYTKIIQWGRANPTRFIEDFFKNIRNTLDKIYQVIYYTCIFANANSK